MADPFADIPRSLQDLLPKWAHFCLYTERFITHELGVELEGKRIVVGLSGGIDSTALLLVLRYLSVRNDFTVLAAHLDHNLRDESAEDARWCEQLCESLDIQCVTDVCNVTETAQEAGIGLEEAGRHARYAFYQDILADKHADLIALGHHQGDLSEDVLMRFIRGTGWPGLSGMTGYDEERSLIRPFLMLPKSTLKAFLTYAGVEWREDISNEDPLWMRNRIRNEVLPLILRENPNFGDSVGRLWKIGRIETEYWDELADSVAESLDNATLAASHKAVRLRMYKACLDKIGPGQALAHSLFKLDEAWEEKKVGAVLQFPGDKTATITASGVDFAVTH